MEVFFCLLGIGLQFLSIFKSGINIMDGAWTLYAIVSASTIIDKLLRSIPDNDRNSVIITSQDCFYCSSAFEDSISSEQSSRWSYRLLSRLCIQVTNVICIQWEVFLENLRGDQRPDVFDPPVVEFLDCL